MEKISKAFSYIMIFVGAYVMFMLLAMSAEHKLDTDNEYVAPADGFTISNYDIMLNVDEYEVIDVEEKIGINFYEEGHHGIYRVIPTWLKYTNKDGETESRKSKVTNLTSSDQYEVSKAGEKLKIKIGNPSEYVTVGLHDYKIKYTYDMGLDPYEGFDEFIFHAYGDYWGTRINNATIEIKMPKAFDESKVNFYADKTRKLDITDKVNYYVTNNTLYARLSDDYNLYKSLTVTIELPEGYFINA